MSESEKFRAGVPTNCNRCSRQIVFVRTEIGPRAIDLESWDSERRFDPAKHVQHKCRTIQKTGQRVTDEYMKAFDKVFGK